jgi:hypothetical protein
MKGQKLRDSCFSDCRSDSLLWGTAPDTCTRKQNSVSQHGTARHYREKPMNRKKFVALDSLISFLRTPTDAETVAQKRLKGDR